MGKLRAYRQPVTTAALIAATLAAGSLEVRGVAADTYTDAIIPIGGTAGGEVAGSATDDADGQNHALLWLADGTLADLQPAGYTNSSANGTNGAQQVGAGVPTSPPAGEYAHALLWSGTAGSVVDLKPAAGYETSTVADGISPNGAQQVGTGYGSATGYSGHALLWSGTAASVVDLHPTNLTGFDRSFAYGTDGTHQVGYGGFSGSSHALLWSGTADSAVDLHPASGFTDSFAEGVSGTQQVGYGYTSGAFAVHALLWTGTAASVVDLNPAGYKGSYAYSTNGTSQVGYGQDASYQARALLWSGTAASAEDLSLLLPADGTWTFSIAYDIDATGDIFGWANGTLNGVTDKYAIEWSPAAVIPLDALLSPAISPADGAYTASVLYELAVPTAPVPEPASAATLLLGGVALLSRRGRRRA